jgi:hypothetical protein
MKNPKLYIEQTLGTPLKYLNPHQQLHQQPHYHSGDYKAPTQRAFARPVSAGGIESEPQSTVLRKLPN